MVLLSKEFIRELSRLHIALRACKQIDNNGRQVDVDVDVVKCWSFEESSTGCIELWEQIGNIGGVDVVKSSVETRSWRRELSLTDFIELWELAGRLVTTVAKLMLVFLLMFWYVAVDVVECWSLEELSRLHRAPRACKQIGNTGRQVRLPFCEIGVGADGPPSYAECCALYPALSCDAGRSFAASPQAGRRIDAPWAQVFQHEPQLRKECWEPLQEGQRGEV